MKYTLLIIWSNLKPDLYHSDDKESLEDMVKGFLRNFTDDNKYYIFDNTSCIPTRIFDWSDEK